MSRCPHCTRSFRTLEDEIGMHDCPHCGYPPWEEHACYWCHVIYDRDQHFPYCSASCAVEAECDSEEDQ